MNHITLPPVASRAKPKLHASLYFGLMAVMILAVVMSPAQFAGIPLVLVLMVIGFVWFQQAVRIAAPLDYLTYAVFVGSTLSATVVFPYDGRSGFGWPIATILSFVSLGMMVYKRENEGFLQRINHFMPQIIMFPMVVFAEAFAEETGTVLAVFWVSCIGIPLFWAGNWLFLWSKDKVYRQPEGLWFIGMIIMNAVLNAVNLYIVVIADQVETTNLVPIVGIIFAVICLYVIQNFHFVIHSGTYSRLERTYKSVRTPNLEVALFTLPVALIVDSFRIPYVALIVICVGTIAATLTILASFHTVHDANNSINDELLNISKVDVLTGLANVAGLITALKERNQVFYGSVLFITINNDLAIRDVYGQRFGDTICTEVAANLKQNGRDTEILARIRGNAFLLLSENLPFLQQYSTCLRIKSNLNQKFVHYSGEQVELDIGITCYSVESLTNFTAIVEAANSLHEFPTSFGGSLTFEIAI